MANPTTYTLKSPSLFDSVCQNLRHSESQFHTACLLRTLNLLLKNREALLEKAKTDAGASDRVKLSGESCDHIEALFHGVYSTGFTDNVNRDDGIASSQGVLAASIEGLGLLVRQQVLQSTGEPCLVCSESVCSEIASVLSQYLLRVPSDEQSAKLLDSRSHIAHALSTAAASYPDGLRDLVERAKSFVNDKHWNSAPRELSYWRWEMLKHLAFIGCSQIVVPVAIKGLSSRPEHSPIQNFALIQATLMELFHNETAVSGSDDKEDCKVEDPTAACRIVAALHAALLHFRDACDGGDGPLDRESIVAAQLAATRHVHDTFPEQQVAWLQLARSEKQSDTLVTPAEARDGAAIYQQALWLTFLIVRHLYRVISSDTPISWAQPVRAQVGNLAAAVTRCLDQESQISVGLADGAFTFFRAPSDSSDGDPAPGTEYLTLGILEGLWPGASLDLVRTSLETLLNGGGCGRSVLR